VNWDEMAVVGRIARPHGIRGQVVIDPLTDFPAERFQPGAELFGRRPGDARGPDSLVVTTVRFQQDRPVVGFRGVDDMNAARALAGTELRVPADRLAVLPEATYYRHDLVGCVLETPDGERVGTVTGVEGPIGRSQLVVATPRGEGLVPLVAEFCREVDPVAKRIVVVLPKGLLDVNV
jgi:16S rRNA processing protein RimM